MKDRLGTAGPEFHARLATIVGPRHLLTGVELAPWAMDERGLYPGRAALAVRPGSVAEVAAVLRECQAAGVPVVPVGGHTGLVGGAAAPAGAVILALSRMNRIREVDTANRTMTVEAGAILKTVQDAARGAGLLFPLSLASEGSAQIGGLLATNAGGINVLRYGTMRDLTLGIEAVMPDGQVLSQLRGLRKDNTGYDLRNLLIGSEGTLAVITAAVLRLSALPCQRVTAMVACLSVPAALDLCALVQGRAGQALTAFEYLSQTSLSMLPRHGITLPLPLDAPAFALFDLASADPAEPLADRMEALLATAFERGLVVDGTICSGEAQNLALWDLRERMPEAQKLEGAVIKHDVALPLSRLSAFLDAAGAVCAAHLPGARIVPFGHLGDGNLHYNLAPPPGMDRATFLTHAPAIHRLVHDLVDAMGGSISAEHGIGQMKRVELARYKDPVALAVMRRIKAALDPEGLLNPGKVLPSPPETTEGKDTHVS